MIQRRKPPQLLLRGRGVIGLRGDDRQRLGTMFLLGHLWFDYLKYIVITKSIFKIDDGNIVLS
jgi:hypothetical protein